VVVDVVLDVVPGVTRVVVAAGAVVVGVTVVAVVVGLIGEVVADVVGGRGVTGSRSAGASSPEDRTNATPTPNRRCLPAPLTFTDPDHAARRSPRGGNGEAYTVSP